MNSQQSVNAEERIRGLFGEAASVHLATADRSARVIAAAVDAMLDTLGRGGKIMVFGNGGSAADSQHFAAELVGRFQVNRRALPALSLTTDTSIITSVANDFAYDQVFARQVEALGRPGDVAFGISTSGRSPNVRFALTHAKRLQLKTIALLGSHTATFAEVADITISVPAERTARIQEAHRTTLHAICELIEEHI